MPGGRALKIAGVAVAALAALGFVLAQRWGFLIVVEKILDGMARLFGLPAFASLATLHEHAMAMYRRRANMLAAAGLHLSSWMLGAVEVWITLRVLGQDVGFAEALILESLGQAIRTAAFPVPGAFGIQEGGYMLIGAHLGLAPDIALAVSLVKRVRELILGVPPMIVWHVFEGRRLLVRASSASRD